MSHKIRLRCVKARLRNEEHRQPLSTVDLVQTTTEGHKCVHIEVGGRNSEAVYRNYDKVFKTGTTTATRL